METNAINFYNSQNGLNSLSIFWNPGPTYGQMLTTLWNFSPTPYPWHVWLSCSKCYDGSFISQAGEGEGEDKRSAATVHGRLPATSLAAGTRLTNRPQCRYLLLVRNCRI